MTLSSSWPLQQAVHAALVADATLSNLVAGRIYDRPPQDVAFPYLTLGDTTLSPADTSDGEATTHVLSFAIWSRATGRREAKEIMSALVDALQDADLIMTGHTLINLRFTEAGLTYDKDAAAIRGDVRFRAFTEPTL